MDGEDEEDKDAGEEDADEAVEEDVFSFVSLTAGPGFEEVDDEALAEMCLVVEDLGDEELEEARL